MKTQRSETAKPIKREPAGPPGRSIGKSGQLEQASAGRKADPQLRERQLQSFLNSLEAGAFLKDERCEFTMVTPRFCAIMGRASADLLGTNGYAVLPRSVAWRIAELEQRVIQEGQPLEYDDLFHSKENTGRRIYTLRVFPVLSPNGGVEAIGGIILDSTDKHLMNQAILEAKTAAEKANMAKSDFLANMSHEVRTPLNGILGMADILLRSQLTRDQISMVSTIKNAGYSLLMVLNDILDISKIEAGKMSLENLAFHLRDLVFESTTSLASLAKNKPVEMMVNIQPEAPEFLVGDPVRLRQILLNLVSNALKFTSKGEVIVKIEVLGKAVPDEGLPAAAAPPEDGSIQAPKDAVKLRFSVSDTGIGIPLEKRLLIFQPFEQADASTTRTYGGTGLGLAICHRILTMMGSRLELTSQVGQGSIFWFDLVMPIAAEEELPRLAQLNSSLAQLAGRSILLVDDNAQNRHFLMEELKSLGIDASEAAGVDQALNLLKLNSSRGQPFDLLITDNIMPGKSGLDLVREMRAEPAGRSIPAILLTSGDIPSVSPEEVTYFSAVISKPVRPIELVAAITAALNISKPFLAAEPGPGPSPTARNLRVLLVEDVEMNQVVATRLLEELGHRVVVAGDGSQALALLKERGPKNYDFDLVLMDIQMPGLDGQETTAALRRLEEKHGWPPIPVVAMTAHAMKGDREKYMAAGMDDYLTKPILLDDLARLMDRLALSLQGDPPARPREAVQPVTAPEAQPAAEAAMDENIMKRSFGNNRNLLKKSMELYLRDAPNLMNNLKKALQAEDFKQTAGMAHSIKGISGYYTQAGPFELARLLDLAARKRPGPKMKAKLNHLSAELEKAVAALIAAMNERLLTEG